MIKRISKRKAIKALYNSAGRIFYAEFIKKDGSLRKMTARLGVHKGVTGKGMHYDRRHTDCYRCLIWTGRHGG